MAYQRSTAAAFGLSEQRRRRAARRAAIKRALNARIDSTSPQSPVQPSPLPITIPESPVVDPQAIIIGSDGSANLEPVFSGNLGQGDIQNSGSNNDPSPVVQQPSPQANPPAEIISRPATQPAQFTPQNAPKPSPQVSIALPRPAMASGITSAAYAIASNAASRQSSVSVIGLTLSSSAPSSSSSSDSSTEDSPVQNPPIVVGVILAGILAIAAIAAVVSWIIRARRRQYNNKLADLGLDGASLENAFAEPTVIREKDLQQEDESFELSHGHKRSDSVRYVDPRSGSYDQHMYPTESKLPYHTPRQEDPYYPAAFQITNLAPGDLSTDGHPPAPSRPSRVDLTSRRELGPRFLALQGQSLDAAWQRPQQQLYGHHDLPILRSRYEPPTSTESTHWSTGLRSNLVSALDAVKQAAGDRLWTGPPWSKPAQADQDKGVGDMMNDRFTPAALRPGRKSFGSRPTRRRTQEERDLSFGGMPINSQKTSSGGWSQRSMSRRESSVGHGRRDPGASAVLDELGSFSFEGRSRTPGPTRGGTRGVSRYSTSGASRQSTRLSQGQSTGVSTSVSSSRSGSSSGVRGYSEGMRKRQSRQAC